ncbi:hypothetical protein E3Q06_01772 [Wallemia mellicola]|uniref:Transmembrane protein 242 n=1 Tax=Wallemia mellicola TaxID=1708541 RepID=A0AB74KEB6_9BASI|nr:hypothetical protein E3Q24_01840 [Wallemia mellicola]TIB85712.1 hypothetical protein E3Q21_01863 [Wallemia mellicola]TIB88882.1 hypothetical protein E3Q20_01856 [Wallemia mellicola]TIC24054.1 hypothetical protein E3Q12_01642 [Wallemia mellicola]TIC40952.1 hypothetical protein E3Q07_01851 [Wallemia mellicola]
MTSTDAKKKDDTATQSKGLSKASIAGVSVLAFVCVSASMGATIYRSMRARNKARQALIDFRSNYHIEKKPAPMPSSLRSHPTLDNSGGVLKEDTGGHFTYGDAAKSLGIATAIVGTLAGVSGYYLINQFNLSNIEDTHTKLNGLIRTHFKTLYESIHKGDNEEDDIPEDAREFAQQFYDEPNNDRQV